MARPKDDISAVAIDLASGQESVLRLMERQKEREERDASQRVDTARREKRETSERRRESAKKQADPESQSKQRTARVGERRDQPLVETSWVTPSFKIKATRSREIDQLFYSMKAKGEGPRTKQELVDRALDWLVKKQH